MGLLKTVGVLLLIASIFAAVIIGYKSIPDKELLLNRSLNDSGNVTKGLLLYSVGMMDTTGAWQADWLPEKVHPKGELLFLVEDMPHPDSTLFIIPILLILLVLFFYTPTEFSAKVRLFWILLVLVVVLYFVQMLFAHHYMYVGGEALGMSREVVDANRQVQVDLIKDAHLVGLAVFLFLVGLAAWFKIVSGDKD